MYRTFWSEAIKLYADFRGRPALSMLNDPKIVFMTTLGVNVGDEFIREGIFSFFDEIFERFPIIPSHQDHGKVLHGF